MLVRDLGQLATPRGSEAPLRGDALAAVEVVRDAYVLCEDGRITSFGPMRELGAGLRGSDAELEELDGRGLCAVPGLVDCHTHACFAGDRVDEFELRATGASYEELHAAGGGILATVQATRSAGEANLTEAVRRKPYCVLLLDEMEKAHQDVMELFYQVFDKGFMEDAEGREIDFKNTVILMTSNAASDKLMKMCADPETMPLPEALAEALMPDLRKIFKPALLGRLIVVPYYPIDDASMRKIIELKLGQIRGRLDENHRVPLTYPDELVSEVARRCHEVETGARNVDHILTGTLLPEISRELLARMAEGLKLNRVHVTVGETGFKYDIT